MSLSGGFRSTVMEIGKVLLTHTLSVLGGVGFKVQYTSSKHFLPPIKVAYKKDAKENLHYTTVADRPDIKKATQAAKQASEVSVSLKCPRCPKAAWNKNRVCVTMTTLPISVFSDTGGVQSQAPQGRQPWAKYAWPPRY